MAKRINRALLQDILSKGDGVKTVSSEAVDWVISVAEQAAKNLAESGRRTPAGRLMAPKLDCGLMARHITKPQDQAAAAGVELAQDPGAPAWGPREDWQLAVRSGATKLSFEKWKEQGKNGTTD
ncbi:MAG TPA: hypothetical protein PLF13_14525 [candidate division Zixibacteria bacterium]|nr:hypothetical protein [candidate division Zixibacteria bacterium]